MGLGGISIWQLLIVLLIVVLIFGTKRLRGLGTDLGGALKSFRSAMDESEKQDETRLVEDAAASTEAGSERSREHADS